MKTIFIGDSYEVCKLTSREAQQFGTVDRFAVLDRFALMLDRFFEKANSFTSICSVFATEQEARDWVAEHD